MSELAFSFEETEAFEVERDGIELAFVQDHGPLTLLPNEVATRRRLWLKVLKDWRTRRREKIERDEVALVALFGLVTDGQVAL